MDLKKYGGLTLLITLLLIVVLNFLPVHYTLRLFVGSFGFGSGIVLLLISKSKKFKL